MASIELCGEFGEVSRRLTDEEVLRSVPCRAVRQGTLGQYSCSGKTVVRRRRKTGKTGRRGLAQSRMAQRTRRTRGSGCSGIGTVSG